MNIQSRLSGHWTDEQVIEHIYAGGPEEGHLLECVDCAGRLRSMREQRRLIEEAAAKGRQTIAIGDEPSIEFLAAQRRKIYAKLSQEHDRWWPTWGIARWASAAAVLLALGGGLVFMEENSASAIHSAPQLQSETASISDSELAKEVSQMADSSEPGPTEPLQALFGE